MINVIPATESLNNLLNKTCDEFRKAIDLIGRLDQAIYTESVALGSSIGAHFRHNIDFADIFLVGLKSGKIDYSKRDRDPEIEQNPDYAVEQLKRVICGLEQLTEAVLETNVAVSSEIDDTLCHFSSVSRELEFLHSHTVHHHAMIAEKLKAFGVELTYDFGVAPSTLKYWSEQKNNAEPTAKVSETVL